MCIICIIFFAPKVLNYKINDVISKNKMEGSLECCK